MAPQSAVGSRTTYGSLDLTKKNSGADSSTLRLVVGLAIVAIGFAAAVFSTTISHTNIKRVEDVEVHKFVGDDLQDYVDCECAADAVCEQIEGKGYGKCKISNEGDCIGFDYKYATFDSVTNEWYAHCEITSGRYDCFAFPCINEGFCIDGIDTYECECKFGWTGTNCEKDIDECAHTGDNSVCDEHASCTNMIPDYMCECMPGFQGDGYQVDQASVEYGSILTTGALGGRGWLDRSAADYSRAGCEDIDDCRNNPCLNNGRCIDLWREPDADIGPQSQKFRCDCSATLPQERWIGELCETNFDECAENEHNCDVQATCTDTPGSFTCTCNEHWEGDGYDVSTSPTDFGCTAGVADGLKCPALDTYTGCQDINNCDVEFVEPGGVTIKSMCLNGGTCSEQGLEGTGEFECTCVLGWIGDTCEIDYDECTEQPELVACDVHASCVNTPGSWRCDCNLGWTGDGSDVCIDADDCEFSPCMNGGTCTDAGLGIFEAYICDCIIGWDGRRCDNDWNECRMGIHTCHNMAECINTPGSFSCQCEPGYSGDGYEMCVEIDDCFIWEDDETVDDDTTEDWAIKQYDAEGVLTLKEGRVSPAPWADDFRARDKDGRAVHQCGVWNPGTREFAEHGSCKDVGDAAFLCKCDAGWSDKKCDHNINECQMNTHSCHRYATCTDTEGSYECACNRGYTGDANGIVDCHDIDDCVASGEACVYGRCTDLGVEDKRCKCYAGWEDGLCDLDINECATAVHECAPQAACINTDGSYQCECISGWQGDGFGPEGCEDIDDCGSSPCEQGECIDHGPNAYRCVCKDGWTDTNCDFDENECIVPGKTTCHAEGKCVNTPGSYYCRCVSGYQGDGRTCIDLDDCDPDPCGKHYNADGTLYGGTCQDTGANKFICVECDGYDQYCDQDINECDQKDPSNPEKRNNDCHDAGVCTNLNGVDGKYFCTCKTGFFGDGYEPAKRAGARGCTACDFCDVGYEIDRDQPTCGDVDNTCININECQVNSHDCDIHAACEDTEGSYTCTCDQQPDANGNEWTSNGGLGVTRDGGCQKCKKCEAGEYMYRRCSATEQRICKPIIPDGEYAIGSSAGSVIQCLVKWKEDRKIYPERYSWGGRAHSQSETENKDIDSQAPDYCENPICGVCDWDGKTAEENILEGLEAVWTFRRISKESYLIYNRAGSMGYRCLGFETPDAPYPAMLVWAETSTEDGDGEPVVVGALSTTALGVAEVDICSETEQGEVCEPWTCGFGQTAEGRSAMIANGGVMWNVHALGCEKETGFCETRKYDNQFLLRSLARTDANGDGVVDAMDYECMYFPNKEIEASHPRRVPFSASLDNIWGGALSDSDHDDDLECGIYADGDYLNGDDQEDVLVVNKQATFELIRLDK